MKRLLHTPQRLLCFLMLCLVAFGGGKGFAQEVTLDFTKDYWNLGSTPLDKEQSKTYNGITIKFGNGCRFYTDNTTCLMVGKKDAYFTLPAFDFDVEKIVVDGEENGAKDVTQNIFVGSTAVSTQTKGAKTSNTYLIADKYQSAGTIYTFKVTNKYNTRITAIKIYKKISGDKTSTALSFGESVVKTTLGDEFKILPTLKAGEQTISGKSFIWTSGNKKVATVDNEGNVTTVGAGKTTITASFDGDDTYDGSTASYELMVKTVPEVFFAEESYKAILGEDFTSPELQGVPSGVKVAYSSSNPAVATVDETTGEVSVLTAGTTTITATTSVVEDIYDEATASYELTVEKIDAVKLDFTENNWGLPVGSKKKEVKKTDYTSGGYTITLESSGTNGFYFNEDGYLMLGKTNATLTLPAFDFDVEKIEIVGRKGASASVMQNIYVGEETVSTETKGAETSNTYIIKDGFQSAGTIYTLKVTSDHNTQITAIRIYKKASEEADAFSTTVVDLPAKGLVDEQKVTDVKVGSVKLAFDENGSPLSAPYWSDNRQSVILVMNNKLTISSNSRIKKIAFVFANDYDISSRTTSFSAGTYDNATNELNLSEDDVKNVTLTVGEYANTIRLQKIIVTTYGPSASITIGTNEGYGTYYTDVNYVLPEGLKAYGYTAPNADGTLTKTEEYAAGDVVPANTAVVVEGAKGTYDYFATDKDATKTIEGNLLKGVTETTTIDATENVSRYILTYNSLGELAFYMTNSGNVTVQANRAYLEIAGAQGVSRFVLDGQATGIESNKVAPSVSATIYTLGGVRIKQTTTQGLPAGAYIVNGKVVIVK